MSNVQTTTNTNNQMTNNYDYSKIFLFAPEYATGVISNAGPGDLAIPAGTLIGRIAANQKLTFCKSSAVDGSQFPVGVLAQDVIVPDAGSLEISIGVAGEVAEEKIIFDGADDFDTIVDLRSYRDRIGSDTVGIKLVAATEMTKFDN